MTPGLQDILATLGTTDALEILLPHWDESEACFPETTPRFLTPEGVTFARDYVGLSPDFDAPLVETARRVCESPGLARLAWHCNRLLFDCLDYEGPKVRQWPKLDAALGDMADVFYLLVTLDAAPRARAVHQARGIPEAISRASCGDFRETTRRHEEYTGGRLGADLRSAYWLRYYTDGSLYRLGRMEYMVRPFGGRIHAYRNRQTRQVVALAADGTVFNPQGFIDAEPEAPENGWTARLVEDPEAATGCPISPAGVGVREEVRLSLDTWEKVLGPGDPLLDTHIPAGGGMGLEQCEDTMRQALAFFSRYFPERPFVGFGCGSWILNPELEQIYSPTSNMVLWQRELYLYPWPSGGNSGLYFVFARDDVDPATAPRDTSLRRAILDHLEAGGKMRAGGMFFLTEDFERFGTQVYRSNWPPRELG